MAFLEYFVEIKDPRVKRTKVHNLLDIIGITVCGVMAGAEGWDTIQIFANSRLEWLKSFLELKEGVPSADTIRRVISKINPQSFENAFREWVNDLVGKVDGIISIDGKTVRNKREKSPIHLVSAWTNASGGICLGQVATGKKGGEFAVIPTLLDLLDIKGCIITIDAAGCYKNIAKEITKRNADYCLSVKENQPILHKQLSSYFKDHTVDSVDILNGSLTNDSGHGRIEQRIAYISDDISAIPALSKWSGVVTYGLIIRQRTINGKTSIERNYYISSTILAAERLAFVARSHWGIENCLHWVLDVNFKEDNSRINEKNGQQNLTVARKIALTLLKRDDTKISIPQRKFKSILEPDYMLKLLKLC